MTKWPPFFDERLLGVSFVVVNSREFRRERGIINNKPCFYVEFVTKRFLNENQVTLSSCEKES